MNILVPHVWLSDHLDTNAGVEDISRCLSLCGPSFERTYDRQGDSVFDIEVTTNRVDAASIRGIAREAVAILPEFDFKALLKPLPHPNKIISTNPLDITIQNDPLLCHRIMAVKLNNVKLGPSPAWLQKRLEQIDLRPINNAIDITNYVMWDIGHPIHAFDYDRLIEKKIIVREAKKGESFVTLDGQSHTCRGGEVVFDDGTGTIIDLPGIMGTENTSITDKTTTVLLWIESVDAVKIRRASMGLSIRTQAAVLNEKRVDPELAKEAFDRAINLFVELTGAKEASERIDIYPHPEPLESATITTKQITDYLGVELKPEKINRILTNLGCLVETKNDQLTIIPPSYRSQDLNIPQDYIEEIARIYGYHNLPSVIMPTAIPYAPSTEDFHFEYHVKTLLTGWGLQEMYTYSMVSEKIAKQSGDPIEKHLKISNPLSDDLVYLRRTLLPSLMEVLTNNPQKDLTIFEMQNVYLPKNQTLPREELHLTLASNESFRKLKGYVDALMQQLHVEGYRIETKNDQAGTIMAGKTVLGTLGLLGQNHVMVDILMEKLQTVAISHPTALPIYQFPPVIEDLTFIIPEKTTIGSVIQTIKRVSEQVADVSLKDIYQHNYTFTITYRNLETTLSAEDVAPIRKAVVDGVSAEHHAELVGQLM